jgi:hypothetical protein
MFTTTGTEAVIVIEMPTVSRSQGLDRGWIEGLDEFQAS